VHAHCAACHREGEAAPFALLTYADVRRHAKRITEVTGRRVMPPWKAEHGFGDFLGERRLSDGQIDLLRRWADAGCPEGDAADGSAPAPPRFADGWQLGRPDLVVRMSEAYTVPPDGRDIYRCFVIKVELPPGKYVRAAEYRPGNRRVVHHAVLSTLRSADARRLLEAEPKDAGPGFASGLVAPGDRLPGPAGIWAPGKDPLPLPDGYALAWPAGCDLVLQLHLHPSGKAEQEQSSVGFYLTDEPPRGQVRPVVLINKKVNIPAGQTDYKLTKSAVLPRAADVIGLFPHMHLLGRTVRATATLPDGTTRPLIAIADWDFNWQTYYQYARPVRLPAGTRVEVEWTFDNSADNPTNPSHPPRPVRFGEQTTDEMGALILDVIPVGEIRSPKHETRNNSETEKKQS
jgi:hypothetical protein